MKDGIITFRISPRLKLSSSSAVALKSYLAMASMIQLEHLRVSTPKHVENVSTEFFPPWVYFLWSDEGDDVSTF